MSLKGLVVIVGLGILSFACGDDNPTSSGTVTVTIKNDITLLGVGFAINDVYITPTSTTSWGSDRLGANEQIEHGQSKSFEVAKGTYNLRVIDTDGDEYTKRSVKIESDYTWTVTFVDLFSL